MNLPIRLRLTFWYVGLLAASLIVFSIVVYVFMSSVLLSNLDNTLRQRSTQVAGTVDVVNGQLRPSKVAEQTDTPVVPAAVLTLSRQVSSGPLPAALRNWAQHDHAAFGTGFQVSSVLGRRVATSPINDNGKVVGYVFVWQSLSQFDSATHSLLLMLVLGVPALILAAGFGGVLLAQRALAPVASLTQTASAITESDLTRRVPVSNARDELAELAVTFNAMIDRLESAVQRERRFTADASHELRSPLAVIRAESSLTLERQRSSDEYRQALRTVEGQVTEMEDMIAALLLLARGDTSHDIDQVVDLGSLVTVSIKQTIRGQGRKRPVAMETNIEAGNLVNGSPSLLSRAVQNLLSNAIKFAPEAGGTVNVVVQRRDGQVLLAVEDNGRGVPVGEEERIFEPFFQVQTARTPDGSHGLGLAISRRIVRAHGGEVMLAAGARVGARFEMTLPVVEDTRSNGFDAINEEA